MECHECRKLGNRAYEYYSKNKVNPNGQKKRNYGDKPRNGNGNGENLITPNQKPMQIIRHQMGTM